MTTDRDERGGAIEIAPWAVGITGTGLAAAGLAGEGWLMALPVAAPLVQAGLSQVLPSRLRRLYERLNDRLAAVERDLTEDERFMTAVTDASRIAVGTHLDERIEMLAAALQELAHNPDEWTDELVTRMFVMIERFTPRHLHTMQLFNSTKRVGTVHKDPVTTALGIMRKGIANGKRVVPVADGDAQVQAAIARDLTDFGLFDADMASVNITFGGFSSAPSWCQQSALSVEGQLFLRFLHFYIEPEDG